MEEEEEPAPVYIPSTTPCLGDFPIKAKVGNNFFNSLGEAGYCGDGGQVISYLDMIQKFGVSVVIMKQHESARTAISKCSLACLNNNMFE